MRRAIFPDTKSLQPIPNYSAHANISGSTNSNANVLPSDNTPTQNNLNIQNNIPPSITPSTNSKNNFFEFYLLSFFVIILIAIITYRRIKHKK